MHLTPEMLDGMNHDQRVLMERLNIEVMICHAQLRRAGLRPGETAEGEQNITAKIGRDPVSDDATMLEVLHELRDADQRCWELRRHLQAVIFLTRDLLCEIDVEAGHGIQVAVSLDRFNEKLLALNNSLFCASKVL